MTISKISIWWQALIWLIGGIAFLVAMLLIQDAIQEWAIRRRKERIKNSINRFMGGK
ncbi:MAG: hypothetical protein KDK38_08195 [Leptospiraceae bacterium]|nr:hypothetical protein [Leptospiraceae bacterium]